MWPVEFQGVYIYGVQRDWLCWGGGAKIQVTLHFVSSLVTQIKNLPLTSPELSIVSSRLLSPEKLKLFSHKNFNGEHVTIDFNTDQWMHIVFFFNLSVEIKTKSGLSGQRYLLSKTDPEKKP